LLMALLVCSLRRRFPIAVVQPAHSSAAEIAERRWARNEYVRHFGPWDGDGTAELLGEAHTNGRMTTDELRFWISLLAQYPSPIPAPAYHLTPQAKFLDTRIKGRAVRPDFYFWSPERTDIDVLVEVDGLETHSGKDKHTSDRQRDRALVAQGFTVLRYSGSEIYRSPIAAADDLLSHLRKFAARSSAQRSIGVPANNHLEQLPS
jgi:hypothetical protein